MFQQGCSAWRPRAPPPLFPTVNLANGISLQPIVLDPGAGPYFDSWQPPTIGRGTMHQPAGRGGPPGPWNNLSHRQPPALLYPGSYANGLIRPLQWPTRGVGPRGMPPHDLGRGRGRGPGRMPPGRGHAGTSAQAGRSNAHQPRDPPGQPKRQTVSQSKLRKLAQEEAAPKVLKKLTPAEIEEGERWRADRRQSYPTEANLAEKAKLAAEASKSSQQSGSEAEKRRARLAEVLQLQRRLGIARAAGTDGMRIPWIRSNGFSQQFKPREYHTAPAESAMLAATQASGVEQAPVKATSADDLLGLGDYGSGSEEEVTAEASHGAAEQGPDVHQAQNAADMEAVSIPHLPPSSDVAEIGTEQFEAAAVPSQPVTEIGNANLATASPSAAQAPNRAAGNGLASSSGVSQKQMRRPASALGLGLGSPQKRMRHAAQHPTRHWQNPSSFRRPPLLQRLLAKEIRQEHSHLLQCLHFLVLNNFLQDYDVSRPLTFPVSTPHDDGLAGLRAGIKECEAGSSDQDSIGEE